jgi:signal transduction histidine kinase
MSRLEAGALDLEPEPCAASDLIAAARRDASAVLRGHVVKVRVGAGCMPAAAQAGAPAPSAPGPGPEGCEPELWADYVQAKRVLVNLLANAAKYSPAGSTIAVSAAVRPAAGAAHSAAAAAAAGEPAGPTGAGPEPAREVVFAVQDRGSGIAGADQPHIFDRFYRGSGLPVRGQAGTGLGLAIARGLVEAMGGRIWVESAPGEGATFSFTLPACRAAAPEDGAQP